MLTSKSSLPSISDAYWTGTPAGYQSLIVFGSARNAIVANPDTDPDYQAWIALGNTAWPWPKDETGALTTAALDSILAAYGLPPTSLTAPTAAQLNRYANSKVVALLSAERLYSGPAVAGVTMPAGVTGITCAEGLAAADLLAINAWGVAAPTATQEWTDDLYEVFTLTGAQAVTFSDATLAYGQSVYATLASAALAIKAGTITTTAQIDALSWPT